MNQNLDEGRRSNSKHYFIKNIEIKKHKHSIPKRNHLRKFFYTKLFKQQINISPTSQT